MVTAAMLVIAMALGAQGPAPASQDAPARSARAAADPTAETVALRRAIEALTREMTALRSQMAATETDSPRRFQANASRLQLVQQDIERMKNQRNELYGRLQAAQARLDDANFRLANIQRELITHGELNRQAGEDRLRATYNRQHEQSQQEAFRLEGEIREIDSRIERAERVAENLKRRLKIDDSQADVEEAPPPEPEPR
jgi:chromosome segregation ATPase